MNRLKVMAFGAVLYFVGAFFPHCIASAMPPWACALTGLIIFFMGVRD